MGLTRSLLDLWSMNPQRAGFLEMTVLGELVRSALAGHEDDEAESGKGGRRKPGEEGVGNWGEEWE